MAVSSVPRDQPRTEDRAHLLIDATARQFVKAWFQGIMEGPTQEVMSHIDGVTDDAVTMTALGLMEKQSGQVQGRGMATV